MEVYGDLESGLTIVAELPSHLAGDRHLHKQHMILTVADTVVLAKKLAQMLKDWGLKHDVKEIA